MTELTVEERKEIQIDMLRYFDDFCRNAGIRYSIGEGSLIGAMRHQGFIPWDDDIDIIMLRDEYDKFIRMYSQMENPKYPILTMRPDNDWWECYSRLLDPKTQIYWKNGKGDHGLWVAILPIDNFPDDDKKWDWMVRKMNRYVLLCRLKSSRWDKTRSFVHEASKWIVRHLLPISTYRYGKKREAVLSSYWGKKTRRRGFMSRWEHRPWVCSSEAFDGYAEAMFEGIPITVFKGYDEYLRRQYGDWTQLPPEEKRVAAHGYKVYWK